MLSDSPVRSSTVRQTLSERTWSRTRSFTSLRLCNVQGNWSSLTHRAAGTAAFNNLIHQHVSDSPRTAKGDKMIQWLRLIVIVCTQILLAAPIVVFLFIIFSAGIHANGPYSAKWRVIYTSVSNQCCTHSKGSTSMRWLCRKAGSVFLATWNDSCSLFGTKDCNSVTRKIIVIHILLGGTWLVR